MRIVRAKRSHKKDNNGSNREENVKGERLVGEIKNI